MTILTVTPNPALDLSTHAPEVKPGRKLRCGPVIQEPGGGGINVARLIAELGGQATCFVALGGATGAQFRQLMQAHRLDFEIFETIGDTRQSFHVTDDATGEQYRFVFPGAPLSADEGKRMLEAATSLIPGRRWVVGSGSLPPGLSPDFFGRLANAARGAGARFILDSSGEALIRALGHGLYLMKLNDIEARAAAKVLGLEGEDIPTLAQQFAARGYAENVILTLGAEGAWLVGPDGMHFAQSPKVPVKSAVGAGDSFVGALCHALQAGQPLTRAFYSGVAAAAAAVMTEGTALARKDDIDRLLANLTIRTP